ARGPRGRTPADDGGAHDRLSEPARPGRRRQTDAAATSARWYSSRSSRSRSRFGKRNQTSAAPSRTNTTPAAKAQSWPSTKEVLAAAVIGDAYCGCWAATASALENELWSCDCTPSVILACSAAGAPAMAPATAAA